MFAYEGFGNNFSRSRKHDCGSLMPGAELFRKELYGKEKIYIAGPECFYENGYAALAAMRKKAESLGFGVTLPNDHPLDMNHPNLQKRADSIFSDLKKIMKETTVIIADLEAYRGSEADSGTVYEIGMAYADGLLCYGYTRDKRALAWKDQKYVLKEDGVIYDENGKPAPYPALPFSPAVTGSTVIVQGDFDDCLKRLADDLEERWKAAGKEKTYLKCADSAQTTERKNQAKRRPRLYLADLIRYEIDGSARYEKMKKICDSFGIEAVSPLDWADGMARPETDNPWTLAGSYAENYCRLIKSCDAVLADLSNYRGYECANDVGFECGVGFESGKQLYGYMQDTEICINKIPNYGEAAGYRDMAGCNVENFNYPVNLMFGSSMEIQKGSFEDVIEGVCQKLLDGRSV